jgi:hypothetical protein
LSLHGFKELVYIIDDERGKNLPGIGWIPFCIGANGTFGGIGHFMR